MKFSLQILFAFLTLLSTTACFEDDDTSTANFDNLEISLSWETPGVDLDLDLTDPNGGLAGGGTTLGSNATSTQDILEGPGVETISFDENAPNGQYIVKVSINQLDVSSPFKLTVRSDNSVNTFEQEIINDSSEASDGSFVLTFQKNGGNLTF